MTEQQFFPSQKKLNFIYLLRSIALILILYDHLIPGSYYMFGTVPPVTVIERYFIWPLAITNYFGAFGVDLFFLISGFVIMHSAKGTPSIVGFSLRRFLRIVPPVVFSYFCFSLCFLIVGVFTEHGLAFPTLQAYLASNGALWTLKVELTFYCLYAVFLPVFKKSMFAGTTVLLVITAIVCHVCASVPSLISVGEVFSYIFYILSGSVIYLVWNKNCSLTAALPLCAILWFGIVKYNICTFNPERYNPGSSFGVSALYAILIFLVFLLSEDFLCGIRWSKLVSSYSYGMYLHHMPFQTLFFKVFMTLFPDMPIHLSVSATASLTILCSAFASFLSQRFVEQPIQKLQRKTIPKVGLK